MAELKISCRWLDDEEGFCTLNRDWCIGIDGCPDMQCKAVVRVQDKNQ